MQMLGDGPVAGTPGSYLNQSRRPAEVFPCFPLMLTLGVAILASQYWNYKDERALYER